MGEGERGEMGRERGEMEGGSWEGEGKGKGRWGGGERERERGYFN